jgi:hypothetical protein
MPDNNNPESNAIDVAIITKNAITGSDEKVPSHELCKTVTGLTGAIGDEGVFVVPG